MKINLSTLKQIIKEEIDIESQLKSKEFKKWFGNSKMKTGSNPTVFYHGVGNAGKFNEFKKEYIGVTSGNSGHFGTGFYFTPSKTAAESFSTMYGGTGETMPVYLRIIKPFVVNEKNLAYIGEKYKLNLPDKIPIAIDKKSLESELKKKDPIAFYLYQNIVKYGFDEGWSKFHEKYSYDEYSKNMKIDLNFIHEWIEYTVEDNYRGVPDWMIDDLKENGLNVKLIIGYDEDLRMDYLTNLGQNAKSWTDAIKKEGYDGVDAGEEVCVFEPNQIKSIYNNGNFDNNKNNITEWKYRKNYMI